MASDIWYGRLPHRNFLALRQIFPNSQRPHCLDDHETSPHIIRECIAFQLIWSFIKTLGHISIPFPDWFRTNLSKPFWKSHGACSFH